jgi:hypothetical protein
MRLLTDVMNNVKPLSDPRQHRPPKGKFIKSVTSGEGPDHRSHDIRTTNGTHGALAAYRPRYRRAWTAALGTRFKKETTSNRRRLLAMSQWQGQGRHQVGALQGLLSQRLNLV